MKDRYAKRKLERAGWSIAIDGNGRRIATKKGNSCCIDWFLNGGREDADITCLRVRAKYDVDDSMSDYHAGSFADSMPRALALAETGEGCPDPCDGCRTWFESAWPNGAPCAGCTSAGKHRTAADILPMDEETPAGDPIPERTGVESFAGSAWLALERDDYDRAGLEYAKAADAALAADMPNVAESMKAAAARCIALRRVKVAVDAVVDLAEAAIRAGENDRAALYLNDAASVASHGGLGALAENLENRGIELEGHRPTEPVFIGRLDV